MDVLPDLLEPNLKVVFCGTAVGRQSAERGAYYAGDGNKFWPVLWSIGLTDKRLEPAEYREAQKFGIGLTDLAKDVSGSDTEIGRSNFAVDRLKQSIARYRPFALAFTSKTAGQTFLGGKRNYGRQPETIGATIIYVLPSTSGRANAHWSKSWWQELSDDLQAA